MISLGHSFIVIIKNLCFIFTPLLNTLLYSLPGRYSSGQIILIYGFGLILLLRKEFKFVLLQIFHKLSFIRHTPHAFLYTGLSSFDTKLFYLFKSFIRSGSELTLQSTLDLLLMIFQSSVLLFLYIFFELHDGLLMLQSTVVNRSCTLH